MIEYKIRMEIVEKYKANKCNMSELAQEYGIHRASVSRILRNNGLTAKKGALKKHRHEIKLRFEAGSTKSELARDYGVSRAAIYRVLRDHGLA